MLTSPKSRFIEREAELAKSHATLAATPSYVHVLEVALLNQLYGMEPTTDIATAAAAHQRMIGARDYIRQLLAIGTPPTLPAEARKTPQLHQL